MTSAHRKAMFCHPEKGGKWKAMFCHRGKEKRGSHVLPSRRGKKGANMYGFHRAAAAAAGCELASQHAPWG